MLELLTNLATLIELSLRKSLRDTEKRIQLIVKNQDHLTRLKADLSDTKPKKEAKELTRLKEINRLMLVKTPPRQ